MLGVRRWKGMAGLRMRFLKKGMMIGGLRGGVHDWCLSLSRKVAMRACVIDAEE